jgi:hypothetical protein
MFDDLFYQNLTYSATSGGLLNYLCKLESPQVSDLLESTYGNMGQYDSPEFVMNGIPKGTKNWNSMTLQNSKQRSFVKSGCSDRGPYSNLVKKK